jgi:hypothetical protein
MNSDEIKKKLLRRYAQSDPKLFIRFDGHLAKNREPCDLDGDLISKTETMEFIQGEDVRVLINPKATPEAVGRMLEKIIAWIEQDGFEPPYAKFIPDRNMFKECEVPDYY